MVIKLASKINNSGWRHQLIIDTNKKIYSYGSFLFHSADVKDLTKKQLNNFVQMLKDNDFTEVVK
jgi:hypothetical protein